MNPIAHLSHKKFKDLNYFELLQVIDSYADENRYPKPTDKIDLTDYSGKNNREKAIKIFCDLYHSEYELKEYWKFWNR